MQEENKEPFVQYLQKGKTTIRATSPDEAERLEKKVGYKPISLEEGRSKFEGLSGADEQTDIAERKHLEETIKNTQLEK